MNALLYHILSASIEFCHEFEEKYYTFLKQAGFKQRIRRSKMELAEVLTILIFFHFSGFQHFKAFYTHLVLKHLNKHFFLVSYAQFNKLANELPFLLDLFLKSRTDKSDRFNFIDATSIPICHKERARSNKVFAQKASLGFSTLLGHFFGFKLHLVINQRGQIVNYAISTGKHHDVKYLTELSKNLKGRLCGDKGYISKVHQKNLSKQKLKLITHSKKNMLAQNVFRGVEQKMLRHRGIIESVFNKLKNVLGLCAHKSRSITGFMAHCLATLLAYTFDVRKPSVSLP